MHEDSYANLCKKEDSFSEWDEAIKNLKFQDIPQAQASLYDQLQSLHTLATKFKLYDAADWLKEKIKDFNIKEETND